VVVTPSILEKVYGFSEPLAQTMGLEILFIEEGSQQHRSILRIYLEKPTPGEGVTIEDCERFSRALDPILDIEGDLRGRYTLEVSSPGLNRPLVKPEHYQAQVGKMIKVVTYQEVEGRKKFKGELKEVLREEGGNKIKILVDNKNFNIPLKIIKKANLDFFATEDIKQVLKKNKKSNRSH